MAAGDDVSLPFRVSVSVERLLREPDAVLVHSATIAVDANSMTIGRHEPPEKQNDIPPIRVASAASIYIGATAAFKTSLYRQFGAILHPDTYEDLVLGFRAVLVRGMRYIDEPLIRYRIGVGLSYQHLDKRGERTQRRVKSIRRILGTFRQRRLDLERMDHSDTREIAVLLDDHIQKTLARFQFYTESGAFLKGLISAKPYWYWRAIFAEAKFHLRLID